MKSGDKAKLRRLMGEAAALPPEDALRREVEAKIAEEGGWAEEEWLSLLRLDEQMRLELQNIPMPPRLEGQLLDIPQEGLTHRRRWRSGHWIAVAAAAILVALVAGRLAFFGGPPGQKAALQTFALLAMSDHLDEGHLSVETTQPDRLERELNGELPFRVVVPRLDPELRLIGGRKCVLGSHPVAYSLWKAAEEEYSLFQFRPHDFGLPATLERTIHVPEGPAADRRRCPVLLWTEEGRGYALVGELRSAS